MSTKGIQRIRAWTTSRLGQFRRSMTRKQQGEVPMSTRLMKYLTELGNRMSQPERRRLLRWLTVVFLVGAAYGLWQGAGELQIDRSVAIADNQGAGEPGTVVELASRVGESLLSGGLPALNAAESNLARAGQLPQSEPVGRVPDLPEILDLSQVVWPVTGGVEGEYGWYRDPMSQDWRFRSGMLLKPDRDPAPVRASLGGEVLSIGTSGTGYHVVIAHAEGWRTEYVGLDSLEVTVGSRIEAGETLGHFSVAPHREALYYIVRSPNGTANPAQILYPRTTGTPG